MNAWLIAGTCELCGELAESREGYRCEVCTELEEQILFERREEESSRRRAAEHEGRAERKQGHVRDELLAWARAHEATGDAHAARRCQLCHRIAAREIAYTERLMAAKERAVA